LSLIVCSFTGWVALSREYTMSQPLKCLSQNDLQKCPVEKPMITISSSPRSVLILWVEAFESTAGISGGKLPVNPRLFRLAFVLPRLRCLTSRFDRSDATIATLLRQDTQCARSDIQPATVLGRVVSLQASGEPAGFWRGKGLIERGDLMRVAIIAHQNHLVGIGIPVIQQGRDRVRPVASGAVGRYLDRPPTRQGLSQQTHVGCTDPFVCVIVTGWLARLGWQWRPRFLDELPRLCIHGDQRVPWSRGALIESQDSFHGGHNVRM